MFPNFRHPSIKHRSLPVLLALVITGGPLIAAEVAPEKAATADLVRKAEAALRVKPPSVTHKSKPAPSGNPNDYASTAPYFWPNSAKRDGLPYIRRDGEIYPGSRTAASDHGRAQQMNSTVTTLARAYEATREEIQVMRMALMLERMDVARQVAETAKQKRIAAQIEPDGRQPKELARTKSFSYTKMNLDGMMTLANLAERVGVDLWHYQTKDGRSIRKALDFVVPYLKDPAKKWPGKQIAGIDRAGYATMLRQAAVKFNEPAYQALAVSLSKKQP